MTDQQSKLQYENAIQKFTNLENKIHRL